MKMKFYKNSVPLKVSANIFAFIFLLAFTSAAFAIKPVEDIVDASIPAGLSLDQIKAAIIKGGALRKWAVREESPGELEGILHIRTHIVKVNIKYTQSSYSIIYKDSVNMKYNADSHKIHRNYNSWVNYLNGDIQFALLSIH